MFEHYYSFFHYWLLSCRYVMLEKSILNKPKWGAQTVVREGRIPPGSLGDSTAQNAVFGTSLNDKTTNNDGKRNSYVQT